MHQARMSNTILPERNNRKKKSYSWIAILVVLIALTWQASPVFAEGFGSAVGIRAGAGANQNDSSFTKYEAIFLYDLPWQWQYDSKWMFGTSLGANVGVLSDDGDDSFVGSIGPRVYWLAPGRKIAITLGTFLTYLDKYELGRENFGGRFQFTTMVGIDVLITNSFAIGYTFQHMSNAGIYNHNPGLNTHMIELCYRF